MRAHENLPSLYENVAVLKVKSCHGLENHLGMIQVILNKQANLTPCNQTADGLAITL